MGEERGLCCVAPSRGTARDRERKSAVVGCLLVARIVFLREERRAWRLRMGSADRIAGTRSYIATEKKYRDVFENVSSSRKIEKKKRLFVRSEKIEELRSITTFITLIYKFNELFQIFRAFENHLSEHIIRFRIFIFLLIISSSQNRSCSFLNRLKKKIMHSSCFILLNKNNSSFTRRIERISMKIFV